MNLHRLFLFLAAAWTLFILIMCSIPGENVPLPDVFGIDKVSHFGAFTVFAVLWMCWKPQFAKVAIAGVIFAIFTELWQGLLPLGRSAEFYDVVADVIGTGIGLGFFYLFGQQVLTWLNGFWPAE